MEAQLRDQMNAMSNPTLAPYAKEGECELRVTAKAPTDAEAQALLKPTVEQVKALFGSKVYGVDVSSLEEVVEGLLREKGMTIGVARELHRRADGQTADRCGWSLPSLSGWHRVLHQPGEGRDAPCAPAPVGPVWGRVPRGGAGHGRGGRKALGCDIALATTGVAGPDKDDWDNEVGTMFVAIATPDGTHVRPLKLGQPPGPGPAAYPDRPSRLRSGPAVSHRLPYEDGAV